MDSGEPQLTNKKDTEVVVSLESVDFHSTSCTHGVINSAPKHLRLNNDGERVKRLHLHIPAKDQPDRF